MKRYITQSALRRRGNDSDDMVTTSDGNATSHRIIAPGGIDDILEPSQQNEIKNHT